METISSACKTVVGYFQSLVEYKRLYDIAMTLMKKSQQKGQTVQKKEELEKKLELVSETQRNLEKNLMKKKQN